MAKQQQLSFDRFQGGPSVELLTSAGADPLKDWQISGGVKRLYDKSVKGFIVGIDGSSASIELPKRNKRLGLTQRFIAFQLFLTPLKPFSVELIVTDAEGTRRRLNISSRFRDIHATPLHAQIPFPDIKAYCDSWTTLIIDLQDAVEFCFCAAPFKSVESVKVNSSVKLRRVFTLRGIPPEVYQNDVNIPMEEIPKSLAYPIGVDSKMWLIQPSSISANHTASISPQESGRNLRTGIHASSRNDDNMLRTNKLATSKLASESASKLNSAVTSKSTRQNIRPGRGAEVSSFSRIQTKKTKPEFGTMDLHLNIKTDRIGSEMIGGIPGSRNSEMRSISASSVKSSRNSADDTVSELQNFQNLSIEIGTTGFDTINSSIEKSGTSVHSEGSTYESYRQTAKTYMPTTEYCVTNTEDCVPANMHYAAVNDINVFTSDNNESSAENYASPTVLNRVFPENYMPTTENCAIAIENCLINTEHSASTENYVPTTKNYVPNTENDVPTSENYMLATDVNSKKECKNKSPTESHQCVTGFEDREVAEIRSFSKSYVPTVELKNYNEGNVLKDYVSTTDLENKPFDPNGIFTTDLGNDNGTGNRSFCKNYVPTVNSHDKNLSQENNVYVPANHLSNHKELETILFCEEHLHNSEVNDQGKVELQLNECNTKEILLASNYPNDEEIKNCSRSKLLGTKRFRDSQKAEAANEISISKPEIAECSESELIRDRTARSNSYNGNEISPEISDPHHRIKHENSKNIRNRIEVCEVSKISKKVHEHYGDINEFKSDDTLQHQISNEEKQYPEKSNSDEVHQFCTKVVGKILGKFQVNDEDKSRIQENNSNANVDQIVGGYIAHEESQIPQNFSIYKEISSLQELHTTKEQHTNTFKNFNSEISLCTKNVSGNFYAPKHFNSLQAQQRDELCNQDKAKCFTREKFQEKAYYKNLSEDIYEVNIQRGNFRENFLNKVKISDGSNNSYVERKEIPLNSEERFEVKQKIPNNTGGILQKNAKFPSPNSRSNVDEKLDVFCKSKETFEGHTNIKNTSSRKHIEVKKEISEKFTESFDEKTLQDSKAGYKKAAMGNENEKFLDEKERFFSENLSIKLNPENFASGWVAADSSSQESCHSEEVDCASFWLFGSWDENSNSNQQTGSKREQGKLVNRHVLSEGDQVDLNRGIISKNNDQIDSERGRMDSNPGKIEQKSGNTGSDINRMDPNGGRNQPNPDYINFQKNKTVSNSDQNSIIPHSASPSKSSSRGQMNSRMSPIQAKYGNDRDTILRNQQELLDLEASYADEFGPLDESKDYGFIPNRVLLEPLRDIDLETLSPKSPHSDCTDKEKAYNKNRFLFKPNSRQASARRRLASLNERMHTSDQIHEEEKNGSYDTPEKQVLELVYDAKANCYVDTKTAEYYTRK